MRAAVILILVLLAGCESRIAREERKLGMMKRAGASASDICAQGKKVADAYLDAGDELRYQVAKVSTDIGCQSAQLSEQAR